MAGRKQCDKQREEKQSEPLSLERRLRGVALFVFYLASHNLLYRQCGWPWLLGR